MGKSTTSNLDVAAADPTNEQIKMIEIEERPIFAVFVVIKSSGLQVTAKTKGDQESS